MKLIQLGTNQTELNVNGEMKILFSYETPVAICINCDYYRTSKKWSPTTGKHISNWLEGAKAEEKPQKWFDNFLDGIVLLKEVMPFLPCQP